MKGIRLGFITRVVIFCLMVGVIWGMYGWISYYQAHITPNVLRTLRGNELKEVIYTMVRMQPISIVRYELDQAFPVELPWMHIIGHYIGEEFYSKYGLSAIGMCDTKYNFGCYHGIVQYVARLHGPDPQFLKKLYDACVNQTHSSANCSDPLGHASATLVSFDIPKALGLCDSFFSVPNEQYHCGLGVFMEYFNEYGATLFPPKLNEQALIHMCDSYSLIYKKGCIELSLTYITNQYHYSMNQLIAHCRSYSDVTIVERCLYGVGAIAAEHRLYNNEAEDPVGVCARITDHYDWCMVGIFRTYQSVDQAWRVKPLCALVKEADTKKTCELIVAESSQ